MLETRHIGARTDELALRARFVAFRDAEARLLVRLCVAAAYARALRVPYWMAHSQRDYAAAMLGVKHSTFCRWAKVGQVLCAYPELRDAMRTGRMRMSTVEAFAAGRTPLGLLAPVVPDADEEKSVVPEEPTARACEADAPLRHPDTRAGEATAQGYVRVSIPAPAPIILYIEESMKLARGLVGVSNGDEDAVSALLAEAGTECGERVPIEVAKARFRVRDRCPPQVERSEQPNEDDVADHGDAASTQGHPALPTLGEAARRRAAFRVHEILERLIRRHDGLRFQQEDQLLRWKLGGLHERWGFSSFERFAREILDLPYTSCRERIRNARLRRQENAIALARHEGRITAIQAALLDQLHRSCHVPASDLPRWCDYAAQHTVRQLRAAIAWAKQQMESDYRRWSLSRSAPPDEDQLRTTDHSLESLVRDPGDAFLFEALLRWQRAPLGTLQLVLTRETRDELLVQMASMQDELEEGAAKRVPAWYALCRVFHRAREAWRDHHQAPPAALRRVLDRDGYRCAAPECSQRKNLQVHHIRYRSQGGGNDDGNRVTLCAFHHHHGEHGGLMRVRGQLDAHGRGLRWEMGLDEKGRARRIYQDERLLVAH